MVRLPAAKILGVYNPASEEHHEPTKFHRHFSHHRRQRDSEKRAVIDCEFRIEMSSDDVDKNHTVLGNKHHHKAKWDIEERSGMLWVHVVKAKGLPVMDKDGACDCYCRISLDNGVLHTTTVADTLEPTFNESFYLPVRRLEGERALIEVMDDDFYHDALIGEIGIDLSEFIHEHDPEVELSKLKLKLSKLSPSELRQRALTDGVATKDVDSALNSPVDTKAALIDLIVATGAESANTWMRPQARWFEIERTLSSPTLDDTGAGVDGLGAVQLRIQFCPRDREHELLQKWRNSDVRHGRIEHKKDVVRLRTVTNERKYGWLHGLCAIDRLPLSSPPRFCRYFSMLNASASIDHPSTGHGCGEVVLAESRGWNNLRTADAVVCHPQHSCAKRNARHSSIPQRWTCRSPGSDRCVTAV
eukprot:SAG11_NODE_3420_length_2459_cov_1.170763_1_plen_416_part_00